MKVKIYGFDGYKCQFCANAKRLCEQRRYEYSYTPVNDGVDADGRPVKIESVVAEIADKAGVSVEEIKTMPQIFVDGLYVGGFTEFRAYAAKFSNKG